MGRGWGADVVTRKLYSVEKNPQFTSVLQQGFYPSVEAPFPGLVFPVIWGWPETPFSFFHKIKGTLFIFTNNLIELDMLSMSTISSYWLVVGRGQGSAKRLPMYDSPTGKNDLVKM